MCVPTAWRRVRSEILPRSRGSRAQPASVRRGALAEARRLLGGTSPRFFTRAPAGFWGESYCGLSRSRRGAPAPPALAARDRGRRTRPRARRTVERRGGWRPGTPAARGTPPSGGRRPRVTNIPASVRESWTVRVLLLRSGERGGVGCRFRAEARGTSRLLRARVRSSTRWMSYTTNDVKNVIIYDRGSRAFSACPLGHENPKWAGVANTPRPRSLW